MRIAYIGTNSGTSSHRAGALIRIGHRVNVIDPRDYLPRSPWIDRWLYHTSSFVINRLVYKPILDEVRQCRPDLIWVNQGFYLECRLLEKLHGLCAGPIINYLNDNPFSGGHGYRFRKFMQAVHQYDLLVVVRTRNIQEAERAGARRVLRVFLSADEVAHRPRALSAQTYRRFRSDVAFVGTWMPERGPFLAELVNRGVPLSIWGERWHKAPQWDALKACWRGPGVYDAEAYAGAIQAAKINIGLLSKSNRDLHTQRSMEIPALGGLLCAERTVEHQALYQEDVEAVFCSSAAECAAKCLALLGDPQRRAAIARAGRAKVGRNRNYNEAVVAKVIEAALNG